MKGGCNMASKRTVKKSVPKTHYYSDLRTLAKRANQRMRELEKRDAQSPAYQAVQAKLEMLGKRASASKGRRFSESGRASYNEYEAMRSVLEEFLFKQKTSTIRGYNEYVESVWQGALSSDRISTDIKAAGITKDQWFAMWASLPDKKHRAYDSEEYIQALAQYSATHDNENFDVAKLMKEFEAATDLKSAYAGLGLSITDLENAADLGVL